MMTTLAGRRILITGANRGIGRFLAMASAEAGATVLVHARRRASLDDLVASHGVEPIVAELADERAAEAVAGQLGDRPLDVLVNNAAFEHHAPCATWSLGALEEVLRVNLVQPAMLVRALLPHLRRGHLPAIINVTSIHDTVPVAGNAAYATAKAGLLMYTRSAAIELGPLGIRVNALAPGAIETDMNRPLLDEIGRERFGRWIPGGRIGSCADLFAPFALLAGTASAYMTGARLCVDGGYEHHLVRYGEP
jgi:NAD(P)-dependent dehydrogenase (short-subunit alcohol dehydrogenase family)